MAVAPGRTPWKSEPGRAMDERSFGVPQDDTPWLPAERSIRTEQPSTPRMPDPDVSVCIVNWNGRDMLRDLLASLRTSDPDIRLQVIVVDNASTDDSLAGAEDAFPGVEVVRNDRN